MKALSFPETLRLDQKERVSLSSQDIARHVIDVEIRALQKVADKIGDNFENAIEAVLASDGRLVVCGMGKSGHVGRKIFATLVSTGTPAMFLHPAEAFHGDLGMIKPEDIFLAISNSGETEEIIQLLPFLKESGNILIAFVGRQESTLALNATYVIDVGVEEEACPLKLAPTASTTACLALGDAFAMALMERRGFREENFARFHPGGSLGRKLLGTVGGYSEPVQNIEPTAGLPEVVEALARSMSGVCIVLSDGHLEGIITDGDLKRALAQYSPVAYPELSATKLLNRTPHVVEDTMLCVQGDAYMMEHKVNSLIVRLPDNSYRIYHNMNRGN